MLNRKYFPFERNSYYFGKLLTAKDFEGEQCYLNDKRRFINRITGANGIVSGMSTVMADDTSIILQAGCAFDASGREIIVPETKVIKLSTIEGFSELESSVAYLGISYFEQMADEAYSPMSTGGEAKFNKIRESYKLTLLDENKVAAISQPLDEYVSRNIIYADSDIIVTQYTPKIIAKNSSLVVKIVIRKISSGMGEYSFNYQLDTPNFTNEYGDSIINTEVNSLQLAHEEVKVIKHLLTPKPYIWGSGDVRFLSRDFIIKKDGENFEVSGRQECFVKPIEQSTSEYYLENYYSKSMDKTLVDSFDEKLWIAKIDLFRQKSSLIIDRILPAPFEQYSYNAQQVMQIKQLEEYFEEIAEPIVFSADIKNADIRTAKPYQDAYDISRSTASGVFEMVLGLGYSTKKPVYSEEIMHGLGKGPVKIDVAVEWITTEKKKGAEKSEYILGDANLFAFEEGKDPNEERIYDYSTAVKVLPERGTFVLAVLPKENSGLISLRIRWFATRHVEISKKIKDSTDDGKYLFINPDTIVVPPKGTVHITPMFVNMPAEVCNYKLTDAEGGKIDNNGVYTAPAKEGVYEIRVEAVSNPGIFAHAFVIVTQKKKNSEEAETNETGDKG